MERIETVLENIDKFINDWLETIDIERLYYYSESELPNEVNFSIRDSDGSSISIVMYLDGISSPYIVFGYKDCFTFQYFGDVSIFETILKKLKNIVEILHICG